MVQQLRATRLRQCSIEHDSPLHMLALRCEVAEPPHCRSKLCLDVRRHSSMHARSGQRSRWPTLPTTLPCLINKLQRMQAQGRSPCTSSCAEACAVSHVR